MLHDDCGQFLVDIFPRVNNLTITLVIGDKTHVITCIEFIYNRVTFVNPLFTFLRNEDIVKVEAQTAAECTVVTEVFDIIEELRSTSHTTNLNDVGDDAFHRTLLHQYVLITDFLRYILVHDDTTRSRLNHLAVDTYIHLRVDINRTFVQRDNRLFLRIERESLALYACAFLGNIIQTKNHIL